MNRNVQRWRVLLWQRIYILYATACLVIIFCCFLLTDQAFICKVRLLPGWSVPDHLWVHHPWPCPRCGQSQVQGTSEVGHGACPGYWALISWLIGMEGWKSDFNKLVKWSSVVQADFVTLNIKSCPDVSLGLQEKSVLIFYYEKEKGLNIWTIDPRVAQIVPRSELRSHLLTSGSYMLEKHIYP